MANRPQQQKHSPGDNLGHYLHPAKGSGPKSPMPDNRMMPKPAPGPTPLATPNPKAVTPQPRPMHETPKKSANMPSTRKR